MDDADEADGGRTGGLRRTGRLWRAGGREADGHTSGRGAKERRTGGQGMGGRADGTENGGGRADESGRARTGRTSSWADGRMSRGFKRPRTLFPASLSSAQTTRLTTERVCRALGSALGS